VPKGAIDNAVLKGMPEGHTLLRIAVAAQPGVTPVTFGESVLLMGI
jgi:hypothetical protein